MHHSSAVSHLRFTRGPTFSFLTASNTPGCTAQDTGLPQMDAIGDDCLEGAAADPALARPLLPTSRLPQSHDMLLPALNFESAAVKCVWEAFLSLWPCPDLLPIAG